MGHHVIKMPDIGEGIAQVELVEWFVKVGDSVTEDQVVADVMTDKATVEIPSPVAGTVVSLGGAPGDVMAVGSDLIRIAVASEDSASAPSSTPEDTQSDLEVTAAAASAAPPTPAVAAQASAPPAAAQATQGTASTQPAQPADIAKPPQPSGQQPGQPTAPPAAQAAAPLEAAAAPAAAAQAAAPQSSVPLAVATPVLATPVPSSPATGDSAPGNRPLAAPAVRKRATDLAIDLQDVTGSGPHGQIVHADLDALLQASAGQRPAQPAGGAINAGSAINATSASASPSTEINRSASNSSGEQQIPVIGLRRKIAERMQDAKRRVAHFSYVEEVDVTAIEALRAELNQRWGEQRGRLTLLPLLVRALVVAVRDFPQINARYDDAAQIITRHSAVHLGIATQSDNGLMVPVLRNAQDTDLWHNAREIKRLASAARSGKAVREELSGSTLTLTSLGALGGIVSTPVVNTPEVAIIGVNRIVERPVVVGGQIVVRQMMNLSSSFDHRVVDGMDAAKFIQAVRQLLEQPSLLFID